MTAVPVPGVYSPDQFDACASCGARLCACPDPVYAGVVTANRTPAHGPALPNSDARP